MELVVSVLLENNVYRQLTALLNVVNIWTFIFGSSSVYDSPENNAGINTIDEYVNLPKKFLKTKQNIFMSAGFINSPVVDTVCVSIAWSQSQDR